MTMAAPRLPLPRRDARDANAERNWQKYLERERQLREEAEKRETGRAFATYQGQARRFDQQELEEVNNGLKQWVNTQLDSLEQPRTSPAPVIDQNIRTTVNETINVNETTPTYSAPPGG